MNNVTKFGSAWTPKATPRRSGYLWLGKRLRQLLNAYEEEPVPDRFQQLLDQLDKNERAPGARAEETVNTATSQKPQP